MKRKISLEFLSIVVFTIVVLIIGGYLIARSNFKDVTELNLRNYLKVIAIEYEEDADVFGIIDQYEEIEDYLRITFIHSDGTVLVDSLAEDLENHGDRPEINDLGNIYIRYSDTLKIDMMYLATQFEDEVYLRVAIPISSILPFLNDFIGLSVILGIIVIAVSLVISSTLVNNAMKPLKDVKAILRSVNQGQYDELMPVRKQQEINELIAEINDINQLIAENISSLKSETLKNDFLLNHMAQGVCVLDGQGNITLINQHLRRLYKFNIDINLNKDYRFLFRENDLQNFIKKAYDQHINTSSVIKIKNEFYSVSISYLDKNWDGKPGVIILYTDITSMKNIEQLKRDFFDNASHELKSPLTAIIGSADIILEDMVSDKQTVKDLIARIADEAKRMNNLVMDMLMLSTYENQKDIKNQQKINLIKVMDDVVKLLKPLADDKGIEIDARSIDRVVYADYDQLFQLIKNLMDNAIQYGKKGGFVKANIDVLDKHFVIEIEDNGIGIPKQDQSRVFERFFRVDKARSKSTGGTGLGLSIVKHIVMNLNGYIELESIENKGTNIKIHIPESMLELR